MNKTPDKAFILAAGLGTRLRPYTNSVPKPMVSVAGKTIIQRSIQKLEEAGVSKIVVNTHHLAPVLQDHLYQISSPEIVISHEVTLLDTAGGIKKALSHFGDDPFYIINGDALWEDGQNPALVRLTKAWDDSRMDILLLLQPLRSMTLTQGVGDYYLGADGRAARAKDRRGDYMFAGIRVAHPRIFKDITKGPLSFLALMDKAEEQNRLFALAHDDAWYHISTPDDLHAVDAHLRKKESG